MAKRREEEMIDIFNCGHTWKKTRIQVTVRKAIMTDIFEQIVKVSGK